MSIRNIHNFQKYQNLSKKVLLLSLFVMMSGIFLISRDAQAANPSPNGPERLLTVYEHGVEKTFITSKTTLGDALRQEGILLEASDQVEPVRETKLVAKKYDVNIYRARPVTVVDGVNQFQVMTAEQSPKQIVQATGSILYDEDTTMLKQTQNPLVEGGAGVKLVIDRATPFHFTLYGKSFEARTQSTTIKELLKEKNITLGPNDGMSASGETPIVAGMNFAIWRNGKQTITQEEVIAKTTEQVKDADREVGYRETRTQGKDGKKNVTYEIDMRDGKEVSRKEIASVTIEEPVKEVVVVGAKMTNTFGGNFGEALAKLRGCEAGGRYDRNSGNGYYGAYQYDVSTWANYGGFARADLAPASVQDQKVWETYQRRGWQPWPSCKIKLGLQDIYR